MTNKTPEEISLIETIADEILIDATNVGTEKEMRECIIARISTLEKTLIERVEAEKQLETWIVNTLPVTSERPTAYNKALDRALAIITDTFKSSNPSH